MLTAFLLLIIWTLAAVVYGILSMIGGIFSRRTSDFNVVERIFLLPFFAIAWLISRSK